MSSSEIFTVVAQDHRQPPFTIGSYSTIEKAEEAIVRYFGLRCTKDYDATPHCLSCVSTWRIFEMNAYICVHDLDDEPVA